MLSQYAADIIAVSDHVCHASDNNTGNALGKSHKEGKYHSSIKLSNTFRYTDSLRTFWLQGKLVYALIFLTSRGRSQVLED